MASETIYKCDRCKKTIKFSEKKSLDVRHENKYFDLCENCLRMFFQFMKG